MLHSQVTSGSYKQQIKLARCEETGANFYAYRWSIYWNSQPWRNLAAWMKPEGAFHLSTRRVEGENYSVNLRNRKDIQHCWCTRPSLNNLNTCYACNGTHQHHSLKIMDGYSAVAAVHEAVKESVHNWSDFILTFTFIHWERMANHPYSTESRCVPGGCISGSWEWYTYWS